MATLQEPKLYNTRPMTARRVIDKIIATRTGQITFYKTVKVKLPIRKK